MLNQADINGIEVYDAYGLWFTNGLKNMERPADLKEAESQSWPERDGREYRLTTKLDDYDVSLYAVLSAPTMAEFLVKKAALNAVLGNGLIKEWFVYSTGITYNIKYNRTTNLEFINTVGAISAKFNLELTVTLQQQEETFYILDGNG